jgi:4-amino-4-deoxy-L-arabinose transferase-like glycosyltransferase
MPWIVVLVSGLLGIIYIRIIPPWQSPDEPTHFEYAKVLARGTALRAPRTDPDLQREIIVSLDRHDYWRYVGVERPSPLPETFRRTPFLATAPTQIGKNPPLYYFLASLVLRLAPARTLEAELYRLRLLSLFFALLTVALVAGCAGEVFGKSSPLVAAAAGGAAFLPQFLVVGTAVSSDSCFNFCGAAVVYLLLRFQKSGFSLFRTIAVLLCLGLGLLVNYKGLILVAAFPGVAIIHLIFHRGSIPSRLRLAGGIGLILLAFLAGYFTLVWYAPGIARVFIVRVNIFCSGFLSFLRGQTRFPPGFWGWFNAELFKSFCLKYGWLQFELPPAGYLVLKSAWALSLLGLGVFLFRWVSGRETPRDEDGEAVVTLIFLAGVALGAYYLYWGLKGADTTAQGRHLFPMMPAWAALFTLGWSYLFPARRARTVSYGLMAGFFLLAVGSLLLFIVPTFT